MRLKSYTVGDSLGSVTVCETPGGRRIRVTVRNAEGESSCAIGRDDAEELKRVLPGYVLVPFGPEELECVGDDEPLPEEVPA